MFLRASIVTFLFFIRAVLFSFGQDEAILLIIPNVDASISLDGIVQGQTQAGSALRIVTTPGEHYVEIKATFQGIAQSKGELVIMEAGKQKILRLDFELTPPGSIQELITIAEINFNLPGSAEVIAWQANNGNKSYPVPEYYYAFEKGDEISIDASISNKNGTNLIHVSTYPDGVTRYTNNAFVELKDQRIIVSERSIYRFAFATNHLFARNCFITIRRKPSSSSSVNFNSLVSYKRVLTPVPVHATQEFFINGGLNATFSSNGKSRVLLDVTLPPNTIEWYYRFSASRSAADIENVRKNFSLFTDISALAFNLTGVGAAINTLAVESLTQPPGADYCDIYLLTHETANLFESKVDGQWRIYRDASRENLKSGNVKVTCCSVGVYTLGIRNPSTSYGINVSVEVVAITAQDMYVMEQK